MMTIEDDWMQAVRCTCTEPASIHSQNTTHTPARLLDPTPADQPHPAWPKPCKQMETSDGTVSAPLGMNPTIIRNRHASPMKEADHRSVTQPRPQLRGCSRGPQTLRDVIVVAQRCIAHVSSMVESPHGHCNRPMGAKRVIRCTTPRAHAREVYFRGCGCPQQAAPSPPPSVMCTTHPYRFSPRHRFVERRMPQRGSRMRCHRVSLALVKTTPRCESRAPASTTRRNNRANSSLGGAGISKKTMPTSSPSNGALVALLQIQSRNDGDATRGIILLAAQSKGAAPLCITDVSPMVRRSAISRLSNGTSRTNCGTG